MSSDVALDNFGPEGLRNIKNKKYGLDKDIEKVINDFYKIN